MTNLSTADFEANVPALLKRAAAGEKIQITESGTPIAMLVPPEVPAVPLPTADLAKVVKEMIAWRKQHGPRLGDDLTLRELIHEGRH